MPDEKSPLDQALDHALDLFLFAPIGLALTAGEELPRLVAKGRQRVTGQLALAKLFGQFAVKQGQLEARKGAERLVRQAGEAAERLAARPASSSSSPALRAATPTAAGNGSQTTGAAAAAASARSMVAPAAVADLAIPGYDTLSASQVVQRLGGLSAAELEAVRDYEASTRGRRTILSKAAQLRPVAGRASGHSGGGSTSGRSTSGQSTSGQPGSAAPPADEPPSAQSASGQSPSGESASGEPASGEPASGEPASGEPASGEPASGEPASGEPVSAQSASGQPALGQSASAPSASGE